DGTAIGSAIATAVNRLRTSKSRSRIIILVTDGVNNSGSIEPMTAAQIAAKEGIKIYTVGVGSRGPVPIPIKRQDPFTGEIVTTYQVVRADIDEETLAAIAKTTGGAYFRATTAKTMGDVLARIDALEKTRLTAPKSEKVDELYFRPLAAGMLAFALALLGGDARAQSCHRRRRLAVDGGGGRRRVAPRRGEGDREADHRGARRPHRPGCLRERCRRRLAADERR